MSERRRLLLAAALAVLAAPLLAAPSAPAAFHLIKVREVHPGTANDSYVVLQMLQTGESFVGGHRLRIYDAAGSTLDTFTFNPGYTAPNGGHGNNTILVGDTGVQATFGVAPDDHADPSLNIPASGGAACWLSGSPPDCVAWGNFTGHGSLPAPGAGSPADPLGVPAGMALRRTIAPGCPTLLEQADDADDSATDLFDAFPAPRPNSAAPAEHPCTSEAIGPGGGAGSGGSAQPPPQTRIVRGPGRVTRDRTPTFRFRANRRRARFLCKVDRRRYRRCRPPFTLRRLRPGRHVFRVRARAGGRVDPSPATYRFRVVRRKPR